MPVRRRPAPGRVARGFAAAVVAGMLTFASTGTALADDPPPDPPSGTDPPPDPPPEPPSVSPPSTAPPAEPVAEPEPARVPAPASRERASAPVPPLAPATPSEVGALARDALALLQARSRIAALRGGATAVGADPGLLSFAGLGTDDVDQRWATARADLAIAVASRWGRDASALIADWSVTPDDTLTVVFYALAQLGKSVEYGAAGPDTFDSSGLTMAAWAQAGVALPHYSGAQFRQLPQLALEHLRVGDLPVLGPDGADDVGLYVGDGLMVLAPNGRASVDVLPVMLAAPTGAVRPAGIVTDEERSALTWLPAAPVSAQARYEPAVERQAAIAALARGSLDRLDVALQTDVARRLASLAHQTRLGVGSTITRSDALAGIPPALVGIYQSAARTCPAPDDWWTVLAAIGRQESGHGTANGSSVGPDGTVTVPILGPLLDGNGVARIDDTDGGRWDADPTLDRAVGPMQFIPSTWAAYATRAPERGPGEPDPQNILDAIYSAARYLCAAQRGTVSDPRAAVLSYNHSESYATEVLRVAAGIASEGITPIPAPRTAAPTAEALADADAQASAARAAVSDALGEVALAVADQFGVDPVALVDEWRFAPPTALRAVLDAIAREGGGFVGGDADFVAEVWKEGGASLPTTSAEQFGATDEIDASQVRPGDLVTFGLDGSDHVGIYVGAGIMAHVVEVGDRPELTGYDPARLARFTRVATGQGPLSPTGGWLVRPVDGPIVSGYGPRRHPVYGDVRFHHGVDIDAALGDPVRSAASGVVTAAGWQGGYGNGILVDHGDGFATFYGHLQQIDVAVGERVGAGEVIGRAGSTGVSTGPHVHFEVRLEGSTVDPTLYLPSRADDRADDAHD